MGQTATSPVERPQLRYRESMGEAWFQGFLKSGCLLSNGDGRVWVGCGTARRASGQLEGGLSLYAPDFLLEAPAPWLVYERGFDIATGDLGQLLDAVAGGGGAVWQEPDQAEFARSFEDVQARIKDGELLKAVPCAARTSPLALTIAQRAQALRGALRLSERFPMMAYGFWTEADEGMIGATPELLFEQTPNGLITMALAGTRPVESDRGSLLEDPKEVLEHRLVIDGIVERLAPIGRVTIGTTSELRLPTLIHLHTPMQLEPLAPIAFLEAVAALHPTPAIGAWPLGPGWEWLRAQPNARSRGRYGAPFGLVPPDGSPGKCVVAIRNVQWSLTGAAIHAGCGVVGPSRLEREWSELGSKLDAIQQALGL